MAKTDPILIVPATAPGLGGGHLKRSGQLLVQFRELGLEAYLYLQDPPGLAPSEKGRGRDLKESFAASGLGDELLVFTGEPYSKKWRFIVIDRFKTSPKEYQYWSNLAPLVGIDEGGPHRGAFMYTLDLLPALYGHRKANFTSPSLLPLPERRRDAFPRYDKDQGLRILIAFGAEDQAALSLMAAQSLTKLASVQVDVLLGALNKLNRRELEASGARILSPVKNLKELLADYDVLVSHFGLSAFEALHARLAVLLVSPTPYHEKLAKNAGFISAGLGKKAASRSHSCLSGGGRSLLVSAVALDRLSGASKLVACRYLGEEKKQTEAQFLAAFTFPGSSCCPLCGSPHNPQSQPLARFPDRSYRRCQECRIVYMQRPTAPPIEYGHDYFFTAYKKQYGKTYLEDFPNLERMGFSRLSHIKPLLSKKEASLGRAPRLLDIGCAFGPFLSASRSAGFTCFGLDPAEDAVRFVNDQLKIRAEVGTFPAFDALSRFDLSSFDVISLWYVIEHFMDLNAVLQKISASLTPGGVLAFSTPSYSGISGRKDPKQFLQNSPADHWTIWEPKTTAALLSRYGFVLKKIVVSGHHPERFPLISKAKKGQITYRLASGLSRTLGLGDTFEVYAVKRS
ncbi:hypothetical protein MASR2M78_27070 [Treponema sp.]